MNLDHGGERIVWDHVEVIESVEIKWLKRCSVNPINVSRQSSCSFKERC